MKEAFLAIIGTALLITSTHVYAQTCAELPNHVALRAALIEARKQDNGGLHQEMWGVIVDRSGTVCAVAATNDNLRAQWPGSRLIAAEKANTANAFSLPTSALSTANLYAGTQPGGFLFGIEQGNPLNTSIAYKGKAETFGTDKDPLIGERPGGVIIFGGGLALYNSKKELLGGLGVSGDTSCADHNIAWKTRNALNLDYVPFGMSPDKDDNIIYDIGLMGKSKSGFGHPKCVGKEKDIAKKLPAIKKA